MSHDPRQNKMLFPDIFSKKLEVQFTQEDTSSDSGLLFLKQIVDNLGIVELASKCIKDKRDLDRIKHEMKEMISQRLYQVSAGYEDVNDSDKLKSDPVFKLISKLNKDKAESIKELASSSTLCRLENSITIIELDNLVNLQVELYLKRNKKRFKNQKSLNIKIDLDPTDVITYGAQQLSLYNGYYRETCYLPMVIADGDNGDLIAAILRPGTKHATYLLIPILKRIFKKIKDKYKHAKIEIRADSGFQSSGLLEYFEENDIKYSLALIKNKNINKQIKDIIEEAEKEKQKSDKTIKLFGEFGYKADKWNIFRRVIYKVEVNSHATDVRVLVTNDHKTSPKKVKEKYNKRANVENIIKELKTYSFASRLSCKTFKANFFRLIVASFALIVFQELKKKLNKTSLANSYVNTLREKVIKVAGTIKISSRRIVLTLPKSYPYQSIWNHLLHPI